MTDRLESRLSDLAEHIDWPSSDVSVGVRRRLDRRSPVRPRVAWAAAGSLVALVVLGMVTPGGRSAIADVLGVVGIEIAWSQDPADVGTHRDLALGEAVSAEIASARADFGLLFPATTVGPPDLVYLDDSRVSSVWVPGPGLPEVGDSGVGLLHMQFLAELDRALLTKQLGSGATLTAVQVRGTVGFWIEGAPHLLTYLDTDGVERTETTRLAGNVLMWDEDGVTHRIESGLSEVRAVEIADDLQAGGS
ncbi:MAG TPA: hypothetical protein VMS74_13520 [Acidimicrobiia bacterium]|nr:hypothetical protein [Acidimicrobiia bacterium]